MTNLSSKKNGGRASAPAPVRSADYRRRTIFRVILASPAQNRQK